jgi:hypothetical protein
MSHFESAAPDSCFMILHVISRPVYITGEAEKTPGKKPKKGNPRGSMGSLRGDTVILP